jgi:hypothetical protein
VSHPVRDPPTLRTSRNARPSLKQALWGLFAMGRLCVLGPRAGCGVATEPPFCARWQRTPAYAINFGFRMTYWREAPWTVASC